MVKSVKVQILLYHLGMYSLLPLGCVANRYRDRHQTRWPTDLIPLWHLSLRNTLNELKQIRWCLWKTIAHQCIPLFKYLFLATSDSPTTIKIKTTCNYLTLEVQFTCGYLWTNIFVCERQPCNTLPLLKHEPTCCQGWPELREGRRKINAFSLRRSCFAVRLSKCLLRDEGEQKERTEEPWGSAEDQFDKSLAHILFIHLLSPCTEQLNFLVHKWKM